MTTPSVRLNQLEIEARAKLLRENPGADPDSMALKLAAFMIAVADCLDAQAAHSGWSVPGPPVHGIYLEPGAPPEFDALSVELGRLAPAFLAWSAGRPSKQLADGEGSSEASVDQHKVRAWLLERGVDADVEISAEGLALVRPRPSEEAGPAEAIEHAEGR